MKYDYKKAMAEDIRNYIKDNCNIEAIKAEGTTFDDWYISIEDEMWTADEVTGNGSGSYTFCREIAEEYVKDNLSLIIEACYEFGVDSKTFGEKVFNEEWEYLDVTARCFLLCDMTYGIAKEFWGR